MRLNQKDVKKIRAKLDYHLTNTMLGVNVRTDMLFIRRKLRTLR